MASTAIPGGRYAVNTKTELTLDSTWTINGVVIVYKGIQVLVINEDKLYSLDDDDYTQLSNWKEVPIEDGPDLSDYYTKEETDEAIATAIGDALGGSY